MKLHLYSYCSVELIAENDPERLWLSKFLFEMKDGIKPPCQISFSINGDDETLDKSFMDDGDEFVDCVTIHPMGL